jgi:TPP-dependent indolepyruvate ferredoxin oxidoreductase alpha subunit
MKNQPVRWRLLQGDIGCLSMALKPARSYEEVAAILGYSESLVRQLENSALRKIIRAMARFEKTGIPEP